MGKNSNITNLPIDQQTQVDKLIRLHRYRNLDLIMEAARDCGITGFSRSALHRYLQDLKQSDALCANPDEGTIITIIERGTGEVRVIKTSASGSAIVTLIEKSTARFAVS
jgi:Protein of unknown function (DUF3486)